MEMREFRGTKVPALYLGDGVYAIYDGSGIWLHANDYREAFATDKIYLEPSVIALLNAFVDQINKMKGE